MIMEGSSSLYLTTLSALVVIGIVSEDKMFYIYHLTSGYLVFKRFCDLMGWSFL